MHPPDERTSDSGIHAVVVTCQPDLAALDAQLQRLAPQLASIIVIDNASAPELLASLEMQVLAPGGALVANESNLGVAAALNQGIAIARGMGARHVLLMDQDSLPAPDMVVRLHDALRILESQGERVAAVGPVAEDLRTGEAAPFVRIGFPLNHKVHVEAGEVMACDFLITSGCLVPMAALEEVGGFDASLFIDNVDLDWSFRATRAGYALYGIGDARMGHRIGDDIRKMPLGASFVHSPTRLYYMMRNRILLYRRGSTPRLWVAQDLPRALLKLVRFSLFAAPRLANARAMLAGVRDGLLGRSGPKPEPGN